MSEPLADVDIERARPDDVPELRAIDKACFGHTWTHAQYANVVADQTGVVLVAWWHGTLIGHGWLQLFEERGYIPTIAVLAAFRGRGVGGRLLDAMLDAATRRGASLVTLEVRTRNEPAKRLYESRGFKAIGIRRALYCSPPDDGIVMRWDLD